MECGGQLKVTIILVILYTHTIYVYNNNVYNNIYTIIYFNNNNFWCKYSCLSSFKKYYIKYLHVSGMPVFLRKLTLYLPCTAATQAMRDVMTRGWGIEMPSVYYGIISSSVWIAIFIIISWGVIKLAKW